MDDVESRTVLNFKRGFGKQLGIMECVVDTDLFLVLFVDGLINGFRVSNDNEPR